MASEAAFRVTLECENCGERWGRELAPKTRVDDGGRIVFRDMSCEHGFSGQCGCHEALECPTCELDRMLVVADREPIGGTDAEDDRAVEAGEYGALRVDVESLDNEYEQVDEAGHVKAKRWTGDDGEERLYVRIRDHDDGRRYNEFRVDLD